MRCFHPRVCRAIQLDLGCAENTIKLAGPIIVWCPVRNCSGHPNAKLARLRKRNA